MFKSKMFWWICKANVFSSSVTFINIHAICEILIKALIFRHLKKYLLSKYSCYVELPDSKYRTGIKIKSLIKAYMILHWLYVFFYGSQKR